MTSRSSERVLNRDTDSGENGAEGHAHQYDLDDFLAIPTIEEASPDTLHFGTDFSLFGRNSSYFCL